MRCPTPVAVGTEYRRFAVPCGRRRCPECGAVWLGDARQVVCGALGESPGAVAVIAVTAPGVDELPWDESGTRCREPELSAWNNSAPARWSAMWREASAAVRRYARAHGSDWGLMAKVWEAQQRGALHNHVVLPYGTALERFCTDWVVMNIDTWRERHGFGFVDRGVLQRAESGQRVRKLQPIGQERAAGYLAKYLTADGKGARGIAALARTTTVAGPLMFAARRLTQASGKTMRSLRARRSIYRLYRMIGEGIEAWRSAALVHAVLAGRPAPTIASTQALIEAVQRGRWREVFDVVTGKRITPTEAPVLWDLARESESAPPRREVGLVRLDCVWHGVSASTAWGPARTQIGIVRASSGSDVRPPPRRWRRPASHSLCLAVPSDPVG